MSEGTPNWQTDHPVRRPGRSRDTPRYMPGQEYRCTSCDDKHLKEASPADAPQTIYTQCSECEQRTEHIAVGRALDAYRIYIRRA